MELPASSQLRITKLSIISDGALPPHLRREGCGSPRLACLCPGQNLAPLLQS